MELVISMKENVTFSIGSVALIDKVDAHYHLFNAVFDGVYPKAKDFKAYVKLLVHNRLTHCISLNRLPDLCPEELFELLGFTDVVVQRSLYRDLERVGSKIEVFVNRYGSLVNKHGLVTNEQFIDFSSASFTGEKCPLAELGYSREHQPGRKQITFGISTGINGVPTALTVQKGNVQDKKHFQTILNVVKRVLDPGSALVFDCGANTNANKKQILGLGFNYLTLVPKKRGPYKRFLHAWNTGEKTSCLMGGHEYVSTSFVEDQTNYYVFFSKDLEEDQLRKRGKRFERLLSKNEVKLRKVKRGKELEHFPTREGYVATKGTLQKALDKVRNPFITGLEGFFVLESSIATDSESILRLYKERDRAEKLVRDLKEGTELRPMRHWSKNAVLGYLFVVFLTNCLTSLARVLTSFPLVKNVKLLKKYLMNLTVTFVYPRKAFRIAVLSNNSPETHAIFGDFLRKYGSFDLRLRW